MRTLFASFCLSLHAMLLGDLSVNETIHSECVVLMNGKTGRILWQRNADVEVYPASTTKIATVFYTLMQKPNSLQERITAKKEALVTVSPHEKRKDNYKKCPSYWNESDGSNAGIKEGEVMSLEQLLYATMLASGNDAANVLAEHVGGGSIPKFVDDLNRFLKQLGLTKTHFTNPHGLHHPEHVTTAKDLARLSQCAMYHPTFRKIVKSKTYKSQKITYVQTNRLLTEGKYFYPYAIGIKTGNHSQAKFTLSAAAEKDNRLLVCALLRCKDRSLIWQDARSLFEAAFNERQIEKQVLSTGDQSFARSFDDAKRPLATYTKEPLMIRYYPSEEPELRCLLVWDDIALPIQIDARVGEVQLKDGDILLAQIPLYAKEEVRATWYLMLVRMLEKHWVLTVALLALCIVGVMRVRRRA